MTPEEKRRLKKLGKRLVDQRSQQLQERLREANSAPIGSEEWGRNYRIGTLRERQLRQDSPDKILASTAARDFVLNPVRDAPPIGVPTYYIECSRCRDLLHSVPRDTVACSCHGICIDLESHRFLVEAGVRYQWVTLIGRCT
jgi:hypothetical protein